MEEFNKLTEPIYKKIKEAKPLEEVELILLFIERLFYLDWESKGDWRGGFDLRFKRTPLKGKIDKILIIQPSSIGDVVYSTPLVRGLREKYPGAKISFLVENIAAPIVTDNPDLDEVILLPREEWIRDFKRRSFREVVSQIIGFIKELAAKRFDLVINLHAAPRCAYLTRLLLPKNISGLSVDELGRPVILGSVWNVYKYYITTNRLMQDLSKISLPELYMKIGGAMPKVREQRVFIDPETEEKVAALIESWELKPEEILVGLNPGANFAARRWEPEKYACLGEILIREYGARVIIFGGEGDIDLVEYIVGMMKEKPINLSGKTSLKELIGLIKRCNHFITNDTGPMHIAGACKTKTIVLAGPTNTGPYGGEGHLLLQADLDCVGCGPTSSCKKGDCMQAITVEMVLEAFKYQRGELESPPEFEGVNLYTSGPNPPTRLFSYAPFIKGENPLVDFLALASLNLWIEENNRLNYEEELISAIELLEEVQRHYQRNALRKGIRQAITLLEEWSQMLNEGLRYLEAIEMGETPLIEDFDQLNARFNTTLGGRITSFLEILYPEDSFTSGLRRRIDLYQKKKDSLKSIQNLLEQIMRI